MKSNIKCKIREDFGNDLESISVELEVPYVKPTLFTTVYRPPDSRIELFSFIENMISKIDQEGKECILTGDFNCDLFKSRDNDTKHLKRIYRMYHFKQLIAKLTRVTSDTRILIDYIATNRPDNVSESDVIPCSISDHDAVYMARGMHLPKRRGTPKLITARTFRKFNSESFLMDLRNIQFDQMKGIEKDPNELWQIWKTLFLEVLNKHAPVSNIRIRGSKLPYLTADVRRLARQRDFLRKKANKMVSRSTSGRLSNKLNRITYTVRKLRSDYYTSKIAEHEGNPKATWRMLKQVINRDTKSRDIERICHNGELVDNKALISEAFNQHFVIVGEKLAIEISAPVNDTSFYLSKNKVSNANFKLKKSIPV